MTTRAHLRMVVPIVVATLATGLSAGVGHAEDARDGVPEHVALGDSYSAGSGNLPLSPGVTPFCAQSTRNFAHVLAATTGSALTDVSCGDAQTKDFTSSQYPGVAPQLDAVDADTDLVTVTIGGNDAGTLALAAASCASVAVLTLGTGNPCQKTFGDRFDVRVDTLVYPAVRQALAAVHAKAPQAEVVVVGYPWIMPSTRGCYPSLPVASGDVPYLRALQGHLNTVIARAAAETGSTFVDMSVRSDGRDACAAPGVRWIEPVFGATSFALVHPNVAGEQAMADAVLAALG